MTKLTIDEVIYTVHDGMPHTALNMDKLKEYLITQNDRILLLEHELEKINSKKAGGG